MAEVTIDDLKRILREAAGADEELGRDGNVLDTTFDELGYDSLALLETSSRIQREFDVEIDDETLADVETPRDLLGVINGRLTAGSV
ncbi:acyl carrier protein [Streptomyces sp. NPDC059063]|uniref:acyl carrier protein n=1 Tax=unclassified Streptomyces TaxID=2593676 RepID=UPI00368485B5